MRNFLGYVYSEASNYLGIIPTAFCDLNSLGPACMYVNSSAENSELSIQLSVVAIGLQGHSKIPRVHIPWKVQGILLVRYSWVTASKFSCQIQICRLIILTTLHVTDLMNCENMRYKPGLIYTHYLG